MAGLTAISPTALRQASTNAYTNDALTNGVPVANVGPGSSIGALINAAVIAALQVNYNVTYVAGVARLLNPDGSLSSHGVDVASFFSPFSIVPASATASSGGVTLSTSSPATSQILVPIGARVQTAGGVQFQVIADLANAAYNAGLGGYVIAIGASSVVATVQCLTLGQVGNVPAATVVQLYNGSGIPAVVGVAFVSNGAAFSNAAPGESDQVFVTRAQARLAGGIVGTPLALYAMASAVQPGLTVQIGEGLNAAGNPAVANATVIVNVLGQNAPPSAALLAAVTSVMTDPANKVAGQVVNVKGPTLLPINVTATLKLDGSAPAATVVAAATTSLAAYLNGIGLSSLGATTTAPYALIADALHVPGVSYPTAVQVNGTYADVVAPYGTQIVAGTASLSTQ